MSGKRSQIEIHGKFYPCICKECVTTALNALRLPGTEPRGKKTNRKSPRLAPRG